MRAKEHLRWGTGSLALAILVGAVGGICTSARSANEELPQAIRDRLDEIESELQRIDRQVGKLGKLASRLEVMDEEIDEFALEAEFFADDPILLDLHKRIRELAIKAEAANKERATKLAQATKVEPVDEVAVKDQIDRMLEIPVDMKNISFKRDVAPIIANVCLRCHQGARARNGFDLSTYNGFMTRIQPGDPIKSLVFRKVTNQLEEGDEGREMPPGGMSNFDRKWALIWQQWMLDGAPFDGTDKDAPFTQYYISHDVQRQQMLDQMSVGDVEKLHRLQARYDLTRVSPDKEVLLRESPNFLIYTTLPAADAEYVELLAEAVLEELKTKFGVPSDRVIWRGRLGLTVFADRFDYVSFAKAIDERTPEAYDFGYAQIRPQYQYVAMTTDVPGHDVDGLVAQQIANVFLTMVHRGLPEWAAYGYARAEAAGQWARNDTFREELQQAATLVGQGRKLQDAFSGQIPWIEQAPLAASFFGFAMSVDKTRTVSFVKGLPAEGQGARQNWNQAWQPAVSTALGTNIDQLNGAWLNWLQANSTGKGRRLKR